MTETNFEALIKGVPNEQLRDLQDVPEGFSAPDEELLNKMRAYAKDYTGKHPNATARNISRVVKRKFPITTFKK